MRVRYFQSLFSSLFWMAYAVQTYGAYNLQPFGCSTSPVTGGRRAYWRSYYIWILLVNSTRRFATSFPLREFPIFFFSNPSLLSSNWKKIPQKKNQESPGLFFSGLADSVLIPIPWELLSSNLISAANNQLKRTTCVKSLFISHDESWCLVVSDWIPCSFLDEDFGVVTAGVCKNAHHQITSSG